MKLLLSSVIFLVSAPLAQAIPSPVLLMIEGDANIGHSIGHIGTPDMGTIWNNGKADFNWSNICQVSQQPEPMDLNDPYSHMDWEMAKALVAARGNPCHD